MDPKTPSSLKAFQDRNFIVRENRNRSVVFELGSAWWQTLHPAAASTVEDTEKVRGELSAPTGTTTWSYTKGFCPSPRQTSWPDPDVTGVLTPSTRTNNAQSEKPIARAEERSGIFCLFCNRLSIYKSRLVRKSCKFACSCGQVV